MINLDFANRSQIPVFWRGAGVAGVGLEFASRTRSILNPVIFADSSLHPPPLFGLSRSRDHCLPSPIRLCPPNRYPKSVQRGRDPENYQVRATIRAFWSMDELCRKVHDPRSAAVNVDRRAIFKKSWRRHNTAHFHLLETHKRVKCDFPVWLAPSSVFRRSGESIPDSGSASWFVAMWNPRRACPC